MLDVCFDRKNTKTALNVVLVMQSIRQAVRENESQLAVIPEINSQALAKLEDVYFFYKS